MEVIDLHSGTISRTDDEGLYNKIVYTGSNKDRKVICISETVSEFLDDWLIDQQNQGLRIVTHYKTSENGTPEVYYTTSISGVLLPLENEGEVVSFKFC